MKKKYLLTILILAAILPPEFAIGQSLVNYSVYKLENKIGREVFSFNPQNRDTATQIDILTNDRGTAMKLHVEYAEVNGGIKYTSAGNTSRFTTEKIDTLLTPSGGFPVSKNGSIKMRELLVAYWIKAGRPSVVLSALNGSEIKIAVVGKQKSPLTNEELTVIDIENGPDDIFWIDSKGNAVYLATCDAEGDKREVISDKYQAYFSYFNNQSNGYLINSYAYSNRNLGQSFNDIAIVGGNIIDVVDSGKISYNTMLLLREGKIAYAGQINRSMIPPGALVIDAGGKYLIPGLWNMHVHLFHPQYLKNELLSGVTTLRDMGNEFDFISRLKAAVKDSALPAPRILNAGLLDGNSPYSLGIMRATNDNEIKQNVKKYHDAGFDQIKIYSYVRKNDFDAIVKEARLYNMDVVGHLPVGYTMGYFIDNGMNSISHIHYFVNNLKWGGDDLMAANKDLLDKLIAKKIYLDPTLSVYSLTGDKKIAIYNKLVKLFFDYGIPIVAGTDNEGSVAGEIQSYARLGLGALNAIRSATIVPATVMKIDSRTGSIATGKDADLLILDENPLLNMATLNAINTIVKGQLVIKKSN